MRKILCIVLILVICLSVLGWSVKADNETEKNTVQDLQTRQNELKDQITEANNDLSYVQEELTENLQQVQKLDEKIEKAESELQELETQVNQLKESIRQIEENLAVETEKYETQQQLFEQRMVAIYEAGDTQYLDIILNSRSLSEFLSSYYVISEIAQSDADLLNSIEKRKNEIEKTKEKLDKQKEELATIAQNQSKTNKVLQNTKVVRENYIAKLSDKEKEIQTNIDKYNTQFAEINAQILALAMQGIDTQYIGGVLAWPVPGYTRISSQYGMRVHPITGVYKLHTGVDISAPMGANFIAANDGIITKAEFNTAYGNMILIDHGGGISTLYAHGSQILVQVGQTVKRGDPVLKVGSTGYSTGPHAHFEVRINGVVTNPMPYITNGVIPGTTTEETTDNNTNTTN